MRTFDPQVQAAYDSANFTPVIRGWLAEETTLVQEIQLLYFRKNREKATIKFYWDEDNPPTNEIVLERGILLSGVEHTIFSMSYVMQSFTFEKKIITAECTPFIEARFVASGDVTYQSIISTLCVYNQFLTPVYKNNAAAWKSYKYYPAGKFIITNSQANVLNQLQQKYFIFADDGDDFQMLFFCAPESQSAAAEYTIPTVGLDIESRQEKRRYLASIDENGSRKYTGSSIEPLHNLGYLESTTAHPPVPASGNKGLGSVFTIPANLKYQSGDSIKFDLKGKDGPTFYNSQTFCLDVTEIFEVGTNRMAWRMELRPLEYFNNTAGGALPSTIERVSNFTPLQTSAFDGILSPADNNLQAAMDTIDDHDHTRDLAYINPSTGKMVRTGNRAMKLAGGIDCYCENGDRIQTASDISASSLSLSASTFYHVYAYLNSGTPTIEVVTTAPASPYKGTARSKTGDTSRRYIGSILTDASGYIFDFIHNAHTNHISYYVASNAAPFRVLTW